MSSAFVPTLQTGAFCSRPTLHSPASSNSTCTPRMEYDPNGPATSKYLSNIPVDRLNKAPVITINAFSNPDLNSVSVRLGDLYADQGAGNSLKAGVSIDDEAPPDQSKWARYYSPDTVNEAPVISLYGSDGLPQNKHSLAIIQTEIPIRIPEARTLLGDDEPDPALYEDRYEGRLNMAPQVQVYDGGSDELSHVSADMATEHLNLYAAAQILAKYRS